MKITQESIFFCKEFVQDAETGLVSAFSLVDDVAVPELPTNIGPVSLVTKFTIQDSDEKDSVKLTLEVKDPENKPTKPASREFDLPIIPMQKFSKSGMLIRLTELGATSEGVYTVIVKHNKDVVGRFNFLVKKNKDVK